MICSSGERNFDKMLKRNGRESWFSGCVTRQRLVHHPDANWRVWNELIRVRLPVCALSIWLLRVRFFRILKMSGREWFFVAPGNLPAFWAGCCMLSIVFSESVMMNLISSADIYLMINLFWDFVSVWSVRIFKRIWIKYSHRNWISLLLN